MPVQSHAARSAKVGLGKADTVERHSNDDRRNEGSIFVAISYQTRTNDCEDGILYCELNGPVKALYTPETMRNLKMLRLLFVCSVSVERAEICSDLRYHSGGQSQIVQSEHSVPPIAARMIRADA